MFGIIPEQYRALSQEMPFQLMQAVLDSCCLIPCAWLRLWKNVERVNTLLNEWLVIPLFDFLGFFVYLVTFVIKMLKLSLMWTMAHRHSYASLLCWSTCLNFGIRSVEYCMSRSHSFFLSTYSLILLSPFQRLTQSWLEISNIWPRQLERIPGRCLGLL